jgi:NADH-quinone oxidoreductase subunit J
MWHNDYERIILLFAIFAILTVAGAVAAISFRSLVHSVLALAIAFAGLAAVYLQLGAQFVGLTQILVYVGAVAILIVFAMLLTGNTAATSQPIAISSWKGSGIVVVVAFAILAWAICHSTASLATAPVPPEVSMKQIGNALMTRFALPLETIGLLLTVALLGAVTVAMNEKEKTR